MKKFDQWNSVKKKVEDTPHSYFHEREVFYARVGENVGFEQCGKGTDFERPILVFKKFNGFVFWGIPLSTTKKRGPHYHAFKFIENKVSVAMISQLKLIDAKRLDRKIGKISRKDFRVIKKIISEFVDSTDNS